MSNNNDKVLHGRKPLERFNLQDLVTVNKEAKSEVIEIYKLVRNFGVKKSEAETVINSLGYEDALKYSQFFADRELDKEVYLPLVQAILGGSIKLDTLLRMPKKSTLEIMSEESIKEFNLNEKQLKQKEYIGVDFDTGMKKSKDNPYNAEHTYEHIDSRLDRLEE